MKASDFDTAFDNGEDITDHLDTSNVLRINQEQKRVNVDFPLWMVSALDREAKRLGVTRQSLIKFWISERLSRKSA